MLLSFKHSIILDIFKNIILFYLGSEGPRGLSGIQGERGLPGKLRINLLTVLYKYRNINNFLYHILYLFLGERGLPGPDGPPGTKGKLNEN